jgi:glycosyltransferase involved in cell wall biosynthesis
LNSLERRDLVIEALRYADPGVRLIAIGAPTGDGYSAELWRLAVEAGVADRVEIAGPISGDRKAELISGCCGMIFTPHDESFGRPVLEAFHSRKPVIGVAGPEGGLELVEDGHNGRVYPADPQTLGTGISRLWEDRREAARLGENGLRTLTDRRIDWDTVIEGLTA